MRTRKSLARPKLFLFVLNTKRQDSLERAFWEARSISTEGASLVCLW